jgi:hypothetical protein
MLQRTRRPRFRSGRSHCNSGMVAQDDPGVKACSVVVDPASISNGLCQEAPNMALQRTRRPRLRSGRSLRSLGSPLNARPLGASRRRENPGVTVIRGGEA